MGTKQRVSLRRFTEDIQRWVEENRSDEWIASALGTTPSSVQSFRSRNAIYRMHPPTPLPEILLEPTDYALYEGVVESAERLGVWFDPEIAEDSCWRASWGEAARVEIHLLPEKIVLIHNRETSRVGEV